MTAYVQPTRGLFLVVLTLTACSLVDVNAVRVACGANAKCPADQTCCEGLCVASCPAPSGAGGGIAMMTGGGVGGGVVVAAGGGTGKRELVDAGLFTLTPFELFRGEVGLRVMGRCPGGWVINPLWGTDYYTDQSSVCTAAAHVGLVDAGAESTLTVIVLPGAPSYAATSRFGITSRVWGSHVGSFAFLLPDGGLSGHPDAGVADSGVDAGFDAGDEAGFDAGVDADAGAADGG